MPEHQGQTDETHYITLPSAIEQVLWTQRQCAVGGMVGLDVFTTYVGNNADMQIELSDVRGSRQGTFTDKIYANVFRAEIRVPPTAREVLYATVRLPAHGLAVVSPPLLLTAPIRITNARWSQNEARHGDLLTLTADVEGAPGGTEGEVVIFEHDADGAHDLITQLPVLVEQNHVEVQWEFEYHEDTDDIPTAEESERGYQPPEYFFRARVSGVYADSALLLFKDWIEIRLSNYDNRYMGNPTYILHLPDGSQRQGQLDDDGCALEEDVPPGRVRIEFPNTDTMLFPEGST